MKLLFKQRAFTWFDSYDIYDENENTVYVVKGQLSWGHCLKIFDASEEHELGTVKEQIFSWWPQFELYEGSDCIGTLKKEPWGWFKPRYNIDFNGWHIEGDWTEWDYTITGPDGEKVAAISKELLHWTDTYVLDIADPEDALYVLMFVLAIDAEKGGGDLKGAAPLDGYLCAGHCRSGGCAVCADVRAGHRRGKVFSELKSGPAVEFSTWQGRFG